MKAVRQGEHEFEPMLGVLSIRRPAEQRRLSLAKRGIRSHQQSMTNYEEVRQFVISTPYSAMLQ